MTGSRNGLIAFLRADDKLPALLSYHCLIHQESLCAGKRGFEEVFKEVVHTVNFI
jgi:predicted aminopeptidase